MSAFEPNTEGVFFDLPEDVYRTAPGVNISALKHIGKSPAHYHAEISKAPSEPSPAQQFGTMLHRSCLEPELVHGSYVVRPAGIDYRSKAGKEWRDAQTLPILAVEELASLTLAAKSVVTHPAAASMLLDCQREVAVFKRHQQTGLMLKGRLDIVATDQNGNTVVSDIKTTQDASPKGFPREMAQWGYEQQAAYYMDLMGASFFCFIAVEKTAPFAVGVYCLDEESIAIGRTKNERNLATLKQCQDADNWPAYSDEIQTINLPYWAKK